MESSTKGLPGEETPQPTAMMAKPDNGCRSPCFRVSRPELKSLLYSAGQTLRLNGDIIPTSLGGLVKFQGLCVCAKQLKVGISDSQSHQSQYGNLGVKHERGTNRWEPRGTGSEGASGQLVACAIFSTD